MTAENAVKKYDQENKGQAQNTTGEVMACQNCGTTKMKVRLRQYNGVYIFAMVILAANHIHQRMASDRHLVRLTTGRPAGPHLRLRATDIQQYNEKDLRWLHSDNVSHGFFDLPPYEEPPLDEDGYPAIGAFVNSFPPSLYCTNERTGYVEPWRLIPPSDKVEPIAITTSKEPLNAPFSTNNVVSTKLSPGYSEANFSPTYLPLTELAGLPFRPILPRVPQSTNDVCQSAYMPSFSCHFNPSSLKPCGKYFADEGMLRQHVEKAHRFLCEQGCIDAGFVSSRDLERHYNTAIHRQDGQKAHEATDLVEVSAFLLAEHELRASPPKSLRYLNEALGIGIRDLDPDLHPS
ncbi:hypothetical protein FHL15_011294 [Xylaria flabelliformis]|uniref:C2H2-type domain-containing protein n=1 Tax=Xylaria flabelliformis TaxID=2512241 RepID=A0A553HIS1_9PEZI|nr:hypothetical protein FHL15_011294 [Xylaria flabelliformis]